MSVHMMCYQETCRKSSTVRREVCLKRLPVGSTCSAMIGASPFRSWGTQENSGKEISTVVNIADVLQRKYAQGRIYSES